MFTHDWFSNNIPHWATLLERFKGQPDLHFLEIGCYEGRATKWLLDNILTGEKSFISVIDTFEGSMEHKERGMDMTSMYDNFVENVGMTGKVIVHQGFSQIILRKFQREPQFDFVYVDGSHTAYDTMEDAVLSWYTLKRGGILIFDDYGWNAYPDNPELNPKLAIDSFLAIFTGKYTLLHKQYQVAIQKI